MQRLHKNESGQIALETAIILIAFIVVASVFAFTILSAGSASTERGEQAISAGLEGVQSSMMTRGAIIAEGTSPNVDTLVFTVSLAGGGDPVDLSPHSELEADGTWTANGTPGPVMIGYRDAVQITNSVPWSVNWLVENDGGADDLLEAGELAEITVNLADLDTRLSTNTAFTLEIKPPTGGVLQINRTTPAAISAVTALR